VLGHGPETFAADAFARALGSWAWLDLCGTTPVFTSLFGDVFLRSDAVDFVVAVNIARQLHDRIRDLSPGTRIGEIKLEQP
jgi:hypothetical protein